MVTVLINKKIFWVKYALGFLAVFLFCFFQNNYIVTSEIEFIDKDIPLFFDGFKIVQISDLHNKEFLFNQSQLINKTKKANPDIIVITGDFIDSRRTNLENSMKYINEAVKIAPVYFVSGNHESRNDLYPEVTTALLDAGVTVLDNKIETLEINGEFIDLVGISDPLIFNTKGNKTIKNNSDNFEKRLKKLSKESNNKFNILLSHRPEFFNLYLENNFNLSLTGHAHGGQVRLPFIGGLFSPGEGVLPKYTKGLYNSYTKGSMIVSRGLGNSAFPLRVFNQPEINSITLKSLKSSK